MSDIQYKVLISPQVERDLNEIEWYMAGLGTYQSTIDKFIEHVYTLIEQLQIHPRSGTRLEKKTIVPTRIRFLVVEEYLIFYEINHDTVDIYRILSQKQDYVRILDLT